MCGCFSRHPNRNHNNLFEYIENTLSKIDSNKYQILLQVIIILTSCSMNTVHSVMILLI